MEKTIMTKSGRWRRICGAGAAFARRNAGRLLYYGAVAVVLAAVALAADAQREDEAQELVLPAAEVASTAEEGGEEKLLRIEGMELLRGYGALPAWNGELHQWEAHPATDYALPDGRVLSLCAGRVRTVGESGVYGGFVEIEAEGMLLRYASIEPDAELKAGESVAAGQELGRTADGMPGEGDMGAHLHLELYLDGESADFERHAAKIGQNAD